MGILSRFKDIMSSNVNALLDKMEDPSKMVDQLMRNLNEDLSKVKAETAGVMAAEQRAKRSVENCDTEIGKMQGYAEKAILAGNDDDARQFLNKKAMLTQQREDLQKAYNIAADNAMKMRQMHDKLVEQINDLNARKDAIKAKMSVAKAQQRVNQVGASIGNSKSNISAFERMEEKADRMLDESNAMAELNAENNSLDDLTKKYDVSSPEVEDELAALKAKLNQ